MNRLQGRTLRLASGWFSCWVAMTATIASGKEYSAPAASRECPRTEDVRVKANALIAQMTVAEKAGQLTQQFSIPFSMRQIERSIGSGTVGSLLFVSDPSETNRLQKIAVEQSRLKIPLLFGFDVVHGFRTIFPVPIATAASWDPAMVERTAAVAAAEARSVGVHWTFAPMLDITRDPRWGRIVEGAGEDPFLASSVAAAQVRGFQGRCLGAPGRVMAGPKHFVGYGAAAGGRDYDEASISDADLWNVYLPPFKAAIDAGAGNIMAAYMPLNGIPAAGNHWLLQDVLRDRWNFQGFVVSDADGVKNLKAHGLVVDDRNAAQRALNAGIDMEMAIAAPAFSKLPDELAAGTITVRQLDDAVRRVLETKIRMGLFERPYVDDRAARRNLGALASARLAIEAAERSAVLLRNEGSLLPLDRNIVKSIAVIGPLADSQVDTAGPYVFEHKQPSARTVLAGIRTKVGPSVQVTHVKGVTLPRRLFPSILEELTARPANEPEGDDNVEFGKAVTAARSADVTIMVLGEASNMIGEQGSRSTLDLPGRQGELLDAVVATGKPVILLLMSARPLTLSSKLPQAILDIWYPGSEGGTAVANLIFGETSPAGKLPFTWPRNVGQVPLFYAHLASHEPAKADKRYWNEPGSPAYPFGFGLSYSTFEYSNLSIDRNQVPIGGSIVVSVDLKNTGLRVADEVAQLYLHQKTGTAARPVRELKGFQRVTLKPGEQRTLRFVLDETEFRYWNAGKRNWVQDTAKFDVAVGGSSATPFGATFEVVQAPGASSPDK